MRQIYPFEFLKVSPSLVIRIFMGYLGLLWSTVYIYFLVRNLREGWPRLIAAAPLVVLFLLYPPLMFDRHQETLMVVISTFYVSWLGSQRLLGLVWGKGELCQVRSFLYFSLGFFSPFRFIPPNTTIAPGERVPKVQIWMKTLSIISLVRLPYCSEAGVHSILFCLLHCRFRMAFCLL